MDIHIIKNRKSDDAKFEKLRVITDENDRKIKETQGSVEESSYFIDKILRTLEIESNNRENAATKLKFQIKEIYIKVEKQLAFIKGMSSVLAIVSTIVILSILYEIYFK